MWTENRVPHEVVPRPEVLREKMAAVELLSKRDKDRLHNQRSYYPNDMEDYSLAKSLATDSGLNIIATSCVFPFPLFACSNANISYQRLPIILVSPERNRHDCRYPF